jgi:hypothetical protein
MRTHHLTAAIVSICVVVLAGCEEGAAPADTRVQPAPGAEASQPARGPAFAPSTGGSTLGKARGSAERLRDDVERRDRQLADDIERGRLPGDE